MKKVLSGLPLFVFACACVLPLFSVAGWIMGDRFVLYSYFIFGMMLAALSLLALVFLLASKTVPGRQGAVFSALLLPLSVGNGICFLLHDGSKPTLFFILIACGCAAVLFFRFANPAVLKIISGVLSVLLLLLLPAVYLLKGFSSNTVVKSVPSPQNTYVAEVIDNDQGALGGNTWVNVRDSGKTVNVWIGRFEKPPTRVYTGKWGEAAKMQIDWNNGDVLVINGREYKRGDFF